MSKTKTKNAIDNKKDRLLEIAISEFAKNGYRNTDVQRIADNANVGKGTVYRYFTSKKNLFFSAADYGVRKLIAYIHSPLRNDTPPKERLCSVICAYLKFFKKNPELVEILILERSEFKDTKKSTYFSYWEKNIDKSVQMLTEHFKHTGAPAQNAKLVTEILHDMLYGAIFASKFRKTKMSPKKINLLLDIFCYGAFRNE